MKEFNLKINYRPEIDGLRAIAVLAVIAYHAPEITISNFSFFQGGYLGVDIFFVISGYLISSLIFKEIDLSGNFSFINFYQRRVRRIIPVLLFVVLITFYFAYLFLLPKDLIDFSKSSLSTLGFGSNFYFYFLNLDYSQFSGLKKPLLHTWSLSIEEQFYLIYPLILFVLIRKFNNNFAFCLWAIFFISFFISLIQTKVDPVLSFYSLHSRIWEFACGTLTAFYLKRKNFFISIIFNNILTLFGIIIISLSIFFLGHEFSHPSYWTLIPVVGTCLIILFSSKENLVTKVLSHKLFVSIGLISYSLYMWHYPIFAFTDSFQALEGDTIGKDILTIIVYVLIIFTVSIISYFLIEKPFRKKTFTFGKLLLVLSFLLFIGILTNSYTIYKSGKINKENVQIQLIKDVPTIFNDNCKFASDNKKEFFLEISEKERFKNCKKKYKKFVLIVGDSHAANVFNSISKNSKYDFIIALIKDGCRPSIKDNCHYDNVENFIKKEIEGVKKIIFTQKGSFFLTNTGNPNNPNFTSARKLPILEDEINTTIKYLKKINNLFPIIFIGPHIEPNVELTKNNIKSVINSGNIDIFSSNQNLDIISVDKFLKKEMKKNNINYISKIDQLNFNFKKDFYINGKFTFYDQGHWSNFGEYYFGKKLIDHPYLADIKND